MGRKHFPIEGKRVRPCGRRGIAGSALLRRSSTRSREVFAGTPARKVGGIHADSRFPAAAPAQSRAAAQNVGRNMAETGTKRLTFFARTVPQPPVAHHA
jgi:hypothetical protein